MRSHLVNVYHRASNNFILAPTIERISDQEGRTVQEMYVSKNNKSMLILLCVAQL